MCGWCRCEERGVKCKMQNDVWRKRIVFIFRECNTMYEEEGWMGWTDFFFFFAILRLCMLERDLYGEKVEHWGKVTQ